MCKGCGRAQTACQRQRETFRTLEIINKCKNFVAKARLLCHLHRQVPFAPLRTEITVGLSKYFGDFF